jgi:hypothetical protein
MIKFIREKEKFMTWFLPTESLIEILDYFNVKDISIYINICYTSANCKDNFF